MAWEDAASGLIKTVVMRRVLDLRRRRPASFGPGAGYTPSMAEESGAERVIAFARADEIAVVVCRWHLRHADLPIEATLEFGAGTWCDVVTGHSYRLDGPAPAESLLSPLPIAVLERRRQTR